MGRLSHLGPVTLSCLTSLSLRKMQICKMVTIAASQSFADLELFFFLSHFVFPSLRTGLDSYHSGH